ncbi:MAG TPA: VOC family protein [Gemmatimonadales bacterium]|nr:VOC family protein [Gemmatimonadales bacterium]
MARAITRGRFVWHELLTSDPKAALNFYTRIVGWQAQPGQNDPSHTILKADSGAVGAVRSLPPEAKQMGAPPHWLSYIETPDLDATVERAAKLGARSIKPVFDLPGRGRLAVLADPQGAVFAAFTPSSTMQVNDPPQPGEFSWHELITTERNAALKFYQELFGWEQHDALDVGAPVGIYQIFGWNGKGMGGIYDKPKDLPAPPHWLPYAMVRDTRAAAPAITEAGGRILAGPLEVPGGDLVVIGFDPQGAAFALHSSAPVSAGRREPATAGNR